jgi:hypothetical protein
MSEGTDGARAPTAGAPDVPSPAICGLDVASGPEIVIETTWRGRELISWRRLTKVADRQPR